ncbi:hypothetical protein DVK02_14955 [Halobellus sp. Atlit-31R]|nr:hypothetical protein DVK02_14955 [Halobellus sp. Atlit-31R]
MWQSNWFALAGFATLLTLLWLVVLPRARVYVTSGLSFISWAAAATSAASLQRRTLDGTAVDVGAPVLQYLATALALVSLLVFVLYHFGLYPPEDLEKANNE